MSNSILHQGRLFYTGKCLFVWDIQQFPVVFHVKSVRSFTDRLYNICACQTYITNIMMGVMADAGYWRWKLNSRIEGGHWEIMAKFCDHKFDGLSKMRAARGGF